MTNNNTTRSSKTKETKETRSWSFIDARDKRLGRVATEVAYLLRGKHRPTWLPYKDEGDVVVVINTNHLNIVPRKLKGKMYFRFSGYPGGLKKEPLESLMERDSTEVIRRAVYGMLPPNKLRQKMIGRLKIYRESEHPHSANLPKEVDKK